MMKFSAVFHSAPPPTHVHSHLPDIIHVMSVPRPSPFFSYPTLVYYIEWKPKNRGAWEQGYRYGAVVEKVQCHFIV